MATKGARGQLESSTEPAQATQFQRLKLAWEEISAKSGGSRRLAKDGIYGTLNPEAIEIRLLIVKPGSQNDSLQCWLKIVSLKIEPVPVYETISYCWGDHNATKRVLVNDLELSVPASAADALRRIRLPGPVRVVWIDSICINQKSTEERGQQVSIMGNIYRHGKTNLIYLGSDSRLNKAIDDMEKILAEFAVLPPDTRKMFKEIKSATQYGTKRLVTIPDDTKALETFLSHAWFGRAWTLQEAVLSQRNICYCDLSKIELSSALEVARIIRSHTYFIHRTLYDASTRARDLQVVMILDFNDHAEVVRLLDIIRHRKATDSHDKIYSALGLLKTVPNGAQLELEPDYTRTTKEVFADFTRRHMEASQSLVMFWSHQHLDVHGELDFEDYPSWVPRFDLSVDYGLYPYNIVGSCFSQTSSEASEKTRSAKLRPWSSTFEHIVDSFGEIEDLVKQSLCTTSDAGGGFGQELEVALAGTLCAGSEAMTGKKVQDGDLRERYLDFRECMRSKVQVPHLSKLDNESHQPEVISAAHFSEAMFQACNKRKFFIASNGRLGIGPRFMREDDVVVILYGLSWPAILRPVGGKYHYMGLAYIHGIMNGEAMHEHQKSGNEDTIFELC